MVVTARVVFVCALVLGSAIGQAVAQTTGRSSDEPRAELRPAEATVYAGSPNELRVIVENAREAEIPSLPEVDGLALRVGSRQVSMSSGFVINGRSSSRSRVTFTLVAIPEREGEFRIPPIDVVTGSGRVRTNPAALTARAPAAWDAAEAELSLDETSLVPGQRTGFELELSFPTTAPVTDLSIESDPLASGTVRAELPGRNNAGFARRSFNVELFGKDSYGFLSEQRIGSERRTSLTITGELEAVAPGRVEIGPVRFRVALQTGRRGARGSREIVTVETEPVAVDVAAFPEDGKPGVFDGTVGVYRIDASASETSVRVGDPIELRLEVRGPEPFASFNPPDLSERAAFAQGFRVSPDWRQADPNTYGVRRYETTIRPLRAGVDEIPPVEIGYFEPATRNYGTDSTRAIPIEVEPVRRVTAEDAIVAGGGSDSGAGSGSGSGSGDAIGPRAALASTDPGIWALPTDAAAMSRGSAVLGNAIASPAFMVAAGGPPVLALGMLAFRAASHRRDPAGVRRRRALARAARLARRGDGAGACRSFLADALDRHDRSVTASDALQLGLDRDDPIVRTLADAEAARFAANPFPTQPPTDTPGHELIRALRRCHRVIGREGAHGG